MFIYDPSIAVTPRPLYPGSTIPRCRAISWCRRASFGILIGDKAAWGKGYGSEATRLMLRHAFETLNLNRVWLHVYEYNQRGIRAYEKVGFRREGVLRQDTFRDGRYWDTIAMAVLREEWISA